jgi:hypothetical protein
MHRSDWNHGVHVCVTSSNKINDMKLQVSSVSWVLNIGLNEKKEEYERIMIIDHSLHRS